MKRVFILLLLICGTAFHGCGVYSFTGASIDGKTISIHTMENRAQNVVPTLSATLTDKIRSRILSQTGLAPVSHEEADYDISGTITAYQFTVTGVEQNLQSSLNRLTITIQVVFKNRLDPKADFNQTFTRFGDFPANQSIQAAESRLIETIGTELADDIFNKAFVNW